MREMTQEELEEEQREVRGGVVLVTCLLLMFCVLLGFGLGILVTALIQHVMGG